MTISGQLPELLQIGLGAAAARTFLPPLITRLAIGRAFSKSAGAKLQNIEGVVAAAFVSRLAYSGRIALVLGLLTAPGCPGPRVDDRRGAPRRLLGAAFLVSLGALSAAAANTTQAASGSVAIHHDPVGCVIAETLPRFKARLEPVSRVARARLYFRSQAGSSWYSVPMRYRAGVFEAVIPRPLHIVRWLEYYISVTDSSADSARTDSYKPSVVASASACGQEAQAERASPTEVRVSASWELAPPPPGFSPAGVVIAPLEVEPQKASGAKKAVLVGGAAAAAAALAIGAGGDSAEPPMAEPVTEALRVEVTFLGSDPPPESTISGADPGSIVLTVTFSIAANREPTFPLSLSARLGPENERGGNCVIGLTGDMPLSLRPGVAVMQEVPMRLSNLCALPFEQTSIVALLFDLSSSGGAFDTSQVFAARYVFQP